MVEILYRGAPRKVKRFTCEKCKTVFTAEENDYKVMDGGKYAPTYYEITCPHCHDYLIYNSHRTDLVKDDWRGTL